MESLFGPAPKATPVAEAQGQTPVAGMPKPAPTKTTLAPTMDPADQALLAATTTKPIGSAVPSGDQTVSNVARQHLIGQAAAEEAQTLPGLEPEQGIEKGKFNPLRYVNAGEQLLEQTPAYQSIAKPLVSPGSLGIAGANPLLPAPIREGLNRVVSGLTSPENIATLGMIGFSPRIIQSLATPAFTAQMSEGSLTAINSGVQKYAAGDHYGGLVDISEGLGSAGIIAGGSLLHEGPMREKAGMPPLQDAADRVAPTIPAVQENIPKAGLSPSVNEMPNGDIVRSLNPPSPELREGLNNTFVVKPTDAAEAQGAIESFLKPLYDSDAGITVKTDDVPVASTKVTGKNSYEITLPEGYEPYQLVHEFGEVLAKEGDNTLASEHDNNVIAANHIARVNEPAVTGAPKFETPPVSEAAKPELEAYFDKIMSFEPAELERQDRAGLTAGTQWLGGRAWSPEERDTENERRAIRGDTSLELEDAQKAQTYAETTPRDLYPKADFMTPAEILAQTNRGVRGWRGRVLSEQAGAVGEKRENPFNQYSMMGAGALQKYGAAFYEQDVKPALDRTTEAAKQFAHTMAILANPGFGVPEGFKGAVLGGRGLGWRAQDALAFDSMQGAWVKAFSRMDHDERIDFMDNVNKGLETSDPVLSTFVAAIRPAFDEVWKAREAQEPGAPYRGNYFPRIWKQAPGDLAATLAASGPDKASLLGSGYWMEHRVLDSARQGEAMGGQLLTDNPFAMALAGLGNQWKAVGGQNILDYALDKNLAIKASDLKDQPIPTGWKSFNDPKTGQLYMDPDANRVLTNYLSRDTIKDSMLMKGLLGMSMFDKAVFLMLPVVHAFNESRMSVYDQGTRAMGGIGRELAHMVANPQDFDSAKLVKSVADLVTAPAAPYRMAFGKGESGAMVRRYLSDPKEFASWVGADWLKDHPTFQREVEGLYAAGGRLSAVENWRPGYLDSMRDAWNNNNPAGAAMRALKGAVPAATHLLGGWLFDRAIPQLQVGHYLANLSHDMTLRADELASGGDEALGALRRQTWQRTQDIFGKVDYGGLFWSKTATSAMQLLMMAPGWARGFVALGVKGIGGQAQEFAKLINAEPGPGYFSQNYGKGGPKLHPAMRQALGLIMGEVTLNTLIQAAATGASTGKPLMPWQSGTPLLDMVAPRIGGNDENGHPRRMSMVGSLRTVYSLASSPVHYIGSALNPTLRRGIEVARQATGNPDPKFYDGGYVWDPDEPFAKQTYDAFKYFALGSFPGQKDRAGAFGQTPAETGQGPIWIQNIQRARVEGRPFYQQVGGIFGASPASKRLDETDGEAKIRDLAMRRLPRGGLKPEDQGRSATMAAIKETARMGGDFDELSRLAGLGKNDLKSLAKAEGKTQYDTWFAALPVKEALIAWQKLGPGEREHYWPMLAKKGAAIKNQPQEQIEMLLQKFQEAGASVSPSTP